MWRQGTLHEQVDAGSMEYHAMAEAAPSPVFCTASEGGDRSNRTTEYSRLRCAASSAIVSLRSATCTSLDAADHLKCAERALDEIDALRLRVKVELRCELSDLPGCREVWEGRLDSWTRDASTLRSEFNHMQEEWQRKGLALPSLSPMLSAAATGRYTAMQSTAQLERSTRCLEEATRMAAESEEVGNGVMNELSAQHESMQRLKDNMGIVRDELAGAGRSIENLLARAQVNQLFASIVAAVFAMGLMVYFIGFLGLSLQRSVFAAVLSLLTLGSAMVLRRRTQHRELLEGYLAV